MKTAQRSPYLILAEALGHKGFLAILFEGGDYFWFDISAVMEELAGSMKKQGDSK